MQNPYDMTQVDVPGILAGYTNARSQRVQQMLQQDELERQNAQLDRETKLHAAYARFRFPGADGGMSSAASAYDAPPATSAAPAAVAAMDPGAVTPSATGPLGSIATTLNAMPSDAPQSA